MTKPTLAIACDHAGYETKENIVAWLKELGFKIKDFGPYSADSCDYPDFGYKVAQAVQQEKVEFGIAICTSGFGMCITTNKVSGVRAAVCDEVEQAHSAREHNFCNVLALGASRVDFQKAQKIIDEFIQTPFGEERHQRRVGKIAEIEKLSD